MTDVVFKIRNKKSGLYSTGGTSPNWSKEGRSYSKLGAIKAILTSMKGRHYPRPYGSYNNCEVVGFELTEVASEDVEDL